MSHTDALQELLDGAQAVGRATAWVEIIPGPPTQGRTDYRISGLLRGPVQDAIERQMARVENWPHGGCGVFGTPHRSMDGYEAEGYVILNQPVGAR